jgi:hypothetical protein
VKVFCDLAAGNTPSVAVLQERYSDRKVLSTKCNLLDDYSSDDLPRGPKIFAGFPQSNQLFNCSVRLRHGALFVHANGGTTEK